MAIMIIIQTFINIYFTITGNMAIDFAQPLLYSELEVAYKITMFSMWGIGVDIPRLLVRYARSYPMVINIHSISMMIIGLMTLMYVIAMTATFYTQKLPLGVYMTGINLAQFILSWVLCACVLIQFILGFKLRYEMVTDKLSINMFSIKRVHRYVGSAMSILGKVIVALQLQPIQIKQRILFKTWLFIVGALVLVFIILQVVYRIQTRSVMLKFPLKHKSKFAKHLQQILDNINSNVQNFNDYKDVGVRYFIIDNKMYYIDQNFIHPGGQHIFTMYNGQQINYLFRGTHQISPDFPRHNHTKYAYNYLQQRYVGQIEVQSILLNFTSASQDLVDWRMSAVQKMEGESNLVEFQANNGYVRQLLNVQTFGKYMMISCPSQQIIGKQKRPYSLIISLGNQQQGILHRFKQAYKYYYNSQSSMANLGKNKSQNVFDVNQRKSAIVFCIKKYRYGVFTQFLFSSQADKKFSIMGPYGRGMRLKPKSKGYYIIIAAGTGVLPFIDFFHFLLQKTLLKLISLRAGDIENKKLNVERVQYSDLDGVRVLFIGSFANSKQFYLSNVIKDLYHLNRKHGLNEFDMRLRYNNNQSEPDVDMIKDFFDRRFFEDLLQQNPDRVYYCGPSSIQHTMRKVQAQQGIKNKFFYI